MSTSRFAFRAWRRRKESDDAVPVDVLGVRDAVIGDGLLLLRDRDGAQSLYSVASGCARSLGTFRDTLAAWAALDALDEAEMSKQAAAAA